MAETLKRDLGVDAELRIGGLGEFTIWVGDRKVAEKGMIRFPSDAAVVAAVRGALGKGDAAAAPPDRRAGGRKRSS